MAIRHCTSPRSTATSIYVRCCLNQVPRRTLKTALENERGTCPCRARGKQFTTCCGPMEANRHAEDPTDRPYSMIAAALLFLLAGDPRGRPHHRCVRRLSRPAGRAELSARIGRPMRMRSASRPGPEARTSSSSADGAGRACLSPPMRPSCDRRQRASCRGHSPKAVARPRPCVP
jgi:hypothetical protein